MLNSQGWGLKTRILLPVVALFVLGVGTLLFFLSYRSEENTVNQCLVGAKATIQQFKALRAYYTENVVSKVKARTDLKVSYNHKSSEDAIPLPATMIHDLSGKLSENKNGVLQRLCLSES